MLQQGSEGVFSGYAAVFDRVDQGRDSIAKGAFARSLEERGVSGIKLLWQHDPMVPLGSLMRLYEDAHGLFVEARLNLDVERSRDAYALIKSGAIDGLSIGYRVRQAEAGNAVRRLIDIDLWEISLVTFPMQGAARINGMKAAPHVQDWSQVLSSLRTLTHRLQSGEFA